MKKFLVLCLCLSLPVAQAADDASAALAHTRSLDSSLTGMVLSLFILLLVLIGLYWFARRFLVQRLGIQRRIQPMKVVSVTMLGPKEKIVIVDTLQGEELVLGVTAQQVNLLYRRPARPTALASD